VQLAPFPVWIRVICGIPLVALCPGYSLVAAIFPGRSPGWPERVLLSLGLSLSVAILGALVLNASLWGLQTGSWATLFFVVTVASCLIAARRRANSQPARSVWATPRLRMSQLILLGLAGLVTVAAVRVARTPGPVTGVLGYTVLWMLPADQDENNIYLGVSSNELSPTRYRLTIKLDGQLVVDTPEITLAPGEKWERALDLPHVRSGEIVEAALYRADAPGSVYRRVTLRR